MPETQQDELILNKSEDLPIPEQVPPIKFEDKLKEIEVKKTQVKKYKCTHRGYKIDASPYHHLVVKMIYEGKSDYVIMTTLKENFKFNVSQPSVTAFRKTCYPRRLQEMKAITRDFKKEQTERMRSYAEESMEQATQLRLTIKSIEKQIANLEKELITIEEFETLYQDAYSVYREDFSKGRTSPFMELSSTNPQEIALKTFLKTFAGIPDINPNPTKEEKVEHLNRMADALLRFMHRQSSVTLKKLLLSYYEELGNQRELTVKIRHDIFKAYKGVSLINDLSIVFERFNQIILSECFPTKELQSTESFQNVRSRINATFSEFKVKYQGLAGVKPDSSTDAPGSAEASKTQPAIATTPKWYPKVKAPQIPSKELMLEENLPENLDDEENTELDMLVTGEDGKEVENQITL
jgi:hypothetical protein